MVAVVTNHAWHLSVCQSWQLSCSSEQKWWLWWHRAEARKQEADWTSQRLTGNYLAPTALPNPRRRLEENKRHYHTIHNRLAHCFWQELCDYLVCQKFMQMVFFLEFQQYTCSCCECCQQLLLLLIFLVFLKQWTITHERHHAYQNGVTHYRLEGKGMKEEWRLWWEW